MATKKTKGKAQKDETALDLLMHFTQAGAGEKDDLSLVQSIDDEVKNFLWSLNSNSQYEEDQYGGVKEQGFHPSGIAAGKCLRMGIFEYLGIAPDEDFLGIDPKTRLIFDNGHDVHDRWQKYFTLMSERPNSPIKLIGSWKCFAGGTIILTSTGAKKIEDVNIGDYVYDKDGALRKVTNRFTKKVKKGEMVDIIIGGSNIPLTVTKDHEILSLPIQNCSWKGRDTRKCWSSCTHSVTPGRGCSTEHHKSYKEEWAKASNLEGRLVKYINPQFHAKFSEGEDLMWLLGYYCAEGSCDNNRVSFASSIDEEPILGPVVTDLMKKVFPGCVVNKVAHSKLTRAAYYRFGVGRDISYFQKIGKGVFNKSVPMDMISTAGEAKAFIDGWFTGDGHELRGQKRITTANEGMAYQLRSLLSMCGVSSTIQKCQHENRFSKKPFYVVMWSVQDDKRPQSGGYLGNDFWAKAVVKDSDYSGDVYDLEVEVSHTYNANGIVVHNCKGCGYVFSPDKAIEKPKKGTKCPTCGSTRIKYNEFRIRDKKHRITGKFDGKLLIHGVPHLLEIKSINTFSSSKLVEPMLKHRKQVSLYQYCHEQIPTLFLYEDKNMQDVKWFIHHYQKKIIKDELQWLAEANSYLDKKTLPDKTTQTAQCLKCAFRQRCKKPVTFEGVVQELAASTKPAKSKKPKKPA